MRSLTCHFVAAVFIWLGVGVVLLAALAVLALTTLVVIVATTLAALAWLGRHAAFAALVSRPVRQAVDDLADAFRDAVLDWDPEGEDVPAEALREPLPPVEPARLVEALRGEAERTLEAVAGVLNEAATLREVGACEGAVRELVGELAGRALEAGVRLRVDAAVAGLPAPARAGGWGDKYRRMRAAEGEAPAAPARRAGAAFWGPRGGRPGGGIS